MPPRYNSFSSQECTSSDDDTIDVEKKGHITTTIQSVFDEPNISASDWTGPDDVENPFNWTLAKKVFHTAVPSLLALSSTFASSAYVPSTYVIAEKMNVSHEVALFGYAVYVLGLALGGPCLAPWSELFGRRAVYLASTPLFALFLMGTGFSNNISAIIMTRFFSGLFGCAPLTVAAGSLADIWDLHERSIPTAMFVWMPFLGPTLGPIIGSYALTWRGWRWSAWVELIICAAVYLPVLFTSETSKRQILLKRAAKLNIPGPSSPTDGKPLGQVILYFVGVTLLRPIRMLFTEPVVLAFSIWVAFNFALLYAFFAAFEYCWVVYYKFSPHATGNTFAGLGLGSFVGMTLVMLIATLTAKRTAAQKARGEKPVPEARLPLAMVGGPLMPIALFIFGWATYHRVHWIVPVIAEGIFGMANYLIFMGAMIYMVDVYGATYGASAIAGNALLRYLMGTAFPMFSVQMFENLGVQWASTLLGCIAVVMAVVPFVFYKFGPWLRSRSAYKDE